MGGVRVLWKQGRKLWLVCVFGRNTLGRFSQARKNCSWSTAGLKLFLLLPPWEEVPSGYQGVFRVLLLTHSLLLLLVLSGPVQMGSPALCFLVFSVNREPWQEGLEGRKRIKLGCVFFLSPCSFPAGQGLSWWIHQCLVWVQKRKFLFLSLTVYLSLVCSHSPVRLMHCLPVPW